MKTVKNSDGTKRVDNEEADRLVSSGRAAYCPKSVWKETVRDKGKAKSVPKPVADSKTKSSDKGDSAKSKYQRKKAIDN